MSFPRKNDWNSWWIASVFHEKVAKLNSFPRKRNLRSMIICRIGQFFMKNLWNNTFFHLKENAFFPRKNCWITRKICKRKICKISHFPWMTNIIEESFPRKNLLNKKDFWGKLKFSMEKWPYAQFYMAMFLDSIHFP